jgi:peroxygenase
MSTAGIEEGTLAINCILSDSIVRQNCRFVPEKFEEIFKKHAHTKPDALTGKELQELLQANREPKDLKGW